MRLRAHLPSLALLVGSVTLTLLGLEVIFRMVGVSVGTVQINRRLMRRSANPRILYELRPNAVAYAEVDYRTNSHGMRNRELAEEKPRGATRIAVIGDSIAFGYWVDGADTFPSQLENLLDPAGSNGVEVLNFAVPGYNLEQETERLRRDVLRFSPDLVIVAFCMNDLRAFSHEYGLVLGRAERRHTLAGRVMDGLLERSVLFSWIEYRRALLGTRREPERADNPRRGWAGKLGEQRKELSSHFAAIAETLRGASLPGLVAVFPLLSHAFDDYPYRDLHGAVVETAQEAGLRAVDLLPCFAAYDFRDVRVDPLHPSPLGHRVAAHGVLEAVCDQSTACKAEGLPERRKRACTGYTPSAFPRVRGY